MNRPSISKLVFGLLAFCLAVLMPVVCAWPAEEATGKASQPESAAEEVTSPQSFVVDGEFNVEAAVDYFEDLYRAESSVGEARLTVIRPRSERTLEMKIWSKGDDKALIVIQSPPREKGTATLKVDDNLWNYLPRIKRTIRIPPSMMLSSWMGSDLTNDDLVKEAELTEDYTYELAGKSEDPDGWLIRFTAKPGIVGLWNRFDLVVNPEGTLPLKADYYDRKDRLARTMTWDEVTVFDGKRLPARMTLVPTQEEGHKTILEYLSLDFNVDLPDSTFSLSELERRR